MRIEIKLINGRIIPFYPGNNAERERILLNLIEAIRTNGIFICGTYLIPGCRIEYVHGDEPMPTEALMKEVRINTSHNEFVKG